MNNDPTCSDAPGAMLEQHIQHMLVAVEHELRTSLQGTDELNLIKKLQRPPWGLIGQLDFHDTGQLYPVHFLLFHVLYRLQDTLVKGGEKLHISPLRIAIERQDVVAGSGVPGARDNLRDFYLDLSQYEMPKETIDRMMNNFWSGYRHSGPARPEILEAAGTLGFEAIPESFQTVKQAFRRAVMQAHPDRGGDTETIQTLNQAFSTMKVHFSHKTEQT